MITYPYNTAATEKETYTVSELGLEPVRSATDINLADGSVEYLYIGKDVDLTQYNFIYRKNDSTMGHTLKEVVFEDGRTSLDGITLWQIESYDGLDCVPALEPYESINDVPEELKEFVKKTVPPEIFENMPEEQLLMGYNSINYIYTYNSSLKKVILPNGITKIPECFFGTNIMLEDVIIPDSVTSIGNFAFDGCSSLQSITIPDSVTSIGGYAFNNCSSLQSVTIPSSVTSIRGSAFQSCYTLQSVTIPDSVTSIEACAFDDCTALQSITIPSSVTSIKRDVFGYCSSLQSITIPDSVTSIESYAFRSCTALVDIYYNGSIEQWNNIEKGTSWNENCPTITVHCTDGDVSL